MELTRRSLSPQESRVVLALTEHQRREASREDIVRLLIDNGANVNAADFDGGTPLYWARIRGYDRIQD